MESGPSLLIGAASRPHSSRLTAASYPVHGVIDARYGDMDADGHLNNQALESLHENTRATLNARVFPGVYDPAARKFRLVTATNIVNFLREVHWPSTFQTAIGIGRIGRTSFVASTALFVNDTCTSLCDTALVLLDDDGPTPIPDDAREQLSSLLLRAD
jgi:acyl-CoA thioester hydrolase